MDRIKPSVVEIKCEVCGLLNKDCRPLWCAKSGGYVARKECADKKCIGYLAIPQDSRLRYIPTPVRQL